MAKSTARWGRLQAKRQHAGRQRERRKEAQIQRREREKEERGNRPAGRKAEKGEIVEKAKPVCAAAAIGHSQGGKGEGRTGDEGEGTNTRDIPCCVISEGENGPENAVERTQGGISGDGSAAIFGTKQVVDNAAGGPVPVRLARRMTCSRTFREFLKERFGPENRTDWRFLLYCLFGVQRGEESGRLVIPWETVADCMGHGDDVHRNHVREENATGRVLDDFLRRILPKADATGYHYTGYARELANLEVALGPEALARRDRELRTPAHQIENRVYLETGAKYSPSTRSRYRETDRETLHINEQILTDAAGNLLDYMNAVPAHSFARIPQKRFAEAWAIVSEWEAERRVQAQMHLRTIQDDAVPLYAPSPRGRTVRIFTPRPSLATIESELRRVLIPDWPELDLSSAQLAIAAKDWGLPTVQHFLEEGGSIWQSLCEHMRPADTLATIKPALKKGLYATVFGAAVKNITRFMQEARRSAQLPELSEDVASRFLSHRVMKEVLKGRRRQKQRIRKQGGARDCFGRWIDTRDGGRLHLPSILAQLAQARELHLLEPAIRAALEEAQSSEPRFRIMLWQHDGFSVKVRDKNREDYYLRSLQRQVNERCRRLGYPTRLEVSK